MLSLESLQQEGARLFRYIRTDNNLIIARYPFAAVYEDVTTHRDLISDDLFTEIVLERLNQRDRFDAGTLDVQRSSSGASILIFSHSADLLLPVTASSRYQTSRAIQQGIGRPHSVRSIVEELYGDRINPLKLT